MNGKGDRNRTANREAYRERYDDWVGWYDTSRTLPNLGWECIGEDSTGRQQRMFLGPDGVWIHSALNEPLEFVPTRWRYED
jgi:hypothetical protein